MLRRAVVAFALCLFSFCLFGASPVPDLREYNGTYLGTPESGSVSYSVLYRDNYDGGARSGCNGEGCGKHPGVDIAVPSGTPVSAALGGYVVRSECNASGWGGLVVIESNSSYRDEKVYQVYAHLRRRIAHFGHNVYEGELIGESGGRPGVDDCAGNSTGAHLHFQIDKDNGGALPWYPTGRVDDPDAVDFEVNRHTYNPIPFVLGGYRWTFSRTGFAEYWSPVNVERFGVGRGAFQMVSGHDPWLWRYPWVPCEYGWQNPCSGAIAAEAELYRTVVVEMDLACVSNPAQIYFITDRDPVWDERKSVSFRYSYAASYWVGMSVNSYWRGIITGLRIDPTMGCTPARADADWIYAIALTAR